MFFFERLKLSPWEGRREGKGCPAEGCRGPQADDGSGFISTPALQPGWGSKLGLLEGLEELQREESRNHADEKCLQPWSPALQSRDGSESGRESISTGWGCREPQQEPGRGAGAWGAEHFWSWRSVRGLAKLSQGSSMCVRRQERDNPAWGKD